MNLSEQIVSARLPVWRVLSEFFLDTELLPNDLRHVARTLAISPYSERELWEILRYEVYPACSPNLLCVAGEWVSFSDEWLLEFVGQRYNHRPRLPFPALHGWMYKVLWDQTMTLVKELRLMKITVQTQVNAPIEEVWAAYTSPDAIVQWNAASSDWHTTKASVDLREGGNFCSRMEAKDGSVGFDFEGTYTQVIENQLLEYTFGDRMAQVRFETVPQGTKVTVSFDPETTFSPEQQREGWQAILESFSSFVHRNRK